MDKYVIRTPAEERVKSKNGLPKYRQSTIESLQRVVVVEEMVQAKHTLTTPNQTPAVLAQCLNTLQNSIPSKQVLLDTKLGRVVNKLRKHPEKQVQASASKLLKKWKSFYREQKNRQPIEVRSDKKSEQLRNKAKSLIATALEIDVSAELVETIERTVYLGYARSLKNAYRKTVRTIHFRLKGNAQLREHVTAGTLSPQDLFKECSDTSSGT